MDTKNKQTNKQMNEPRQEEIRQYKNLHHHHHHHHPMISIKNNRHITHKSKHSKPNNIFQVSNRCLFVLTIWHAEIRDYLYLIFCSSQS